MLYDYLAFGGVEVVNTARVAAYPSGWGCKGCPDMGKWTQGHDFTDPVTDQAPWYDSRVPESARVWGVAGISAEGFGDVPHASQGDDGSMVGAVRDIAVTAMIIAADDCAASYAKGWLARVLMARTCGPGCAGHTVCALSCCPESPQDRTTMRTLMGVSTVEGPTEVAVTRASGTVYMQVEWTWRTRNLGIFWPSVHTVELFPALGEPTLIDLPAVYDNCDVDLGDCFPSTACPPLPSIGYPDPPLDPCYPVEPYSGFRSVTTIPARAFPADLHTVAMVTVDAGATPLRNLTVRFHENPFGVDCARLPDLNPCRACSDATIAGVPARGVGLLDGRDGRDTGTLTCHSGAIENLPVWGPRGGLYTPPVFGCGYAVCAEVLVSDVVNPGAKVAINIHPRQWSA